VQGNGTVRNYDMRERMRLKGCIVAVLIVGAGGIAPAAAAVPAAGLASGRPAVTQAQDGQDGQDSMPGMDMSGQDSGSRHAAEQDPVPGRNVRAGGPSSLVRTIALGVFVFFNGGVLTVASVLRRRTPSRRPPRARAVPA
jgi:hypothetical protein